MWRSDEHEHGNNVHQEWGSSGGSGSVEQNPHVGLMGFGRSIVGAGTGAARSGHHQQQRSEAGFSSVSGGPLHVRNDDQFYYDENYHPHLQPQQQQTVNFASPSRTPGTKWSGGGTTMTMGSSDPTTPLFGSPPGTASKSYRPGGGGRAGGGPMFASTRSALRESRARDRRRFMGRLAVRATQPAALFLLAGLAFVLTAASWRAAASSGGTGTASSSGAAVVGAGAAELAGEAAAEILSRAAFGSTAGGSDGTSSERIMIVQPSNLQKTEDGTVLGAEQAAQVEQQQQPLERTAGSTEAVASAVSSSATPVDSPAKGAAGVLWLLDEDGNKKVVLVPRDKGRKTKTKRQQQQPAAQKQGLMQKFGLLKKNKQPQQQQQAQQKKKAQQKRGTGSTETTGTPMQATETDAAAMATASDVAKSTDADADTDVVTYYYDSIPAMTSTGPGEEPPAAAQLAVPEVVYDKLGNSVRLVDLHDGPPSLLPPPLAGEGSHGTPSDLNGNSDALSSSSSARMTASTGSSSNRYSSSVTSLSAEAQGTTNQLIVVATVATVAIFGGALVARKMRTRNFLSSCIENESLEDELAYDAAHTTLGAAVGYDTFSSGDIKWRGDLEKFDV
mmetsp:Transcript_26606/g.59101  ORF Transcript_26606/g.59101 Transcript_26606/m.59101 type:complete len:616 (-) Transcript_26606:159-2006(-)